MSKQLIISVGREYGSGGHEIAERLSKVFDLPFYDYNLLREMAKEKDWDVEDLEKYDEIPKNKLFSRKIRGYSNSPQEIIAHLQFEYMENMAKEGNSFVVVGRCSETVLRNYEGLITIFVTGDKEAKIDRIVGIKKISRKEAEAMIVHTNKKRKEYHNYYCTDKWGDSRNYDITINSSKLGEEKTAEVLASYIKERIKE